MTIDLATHLTLRDVTPADADYWRGRCTVTNPAYASSARYTRTGRPAYGIEPTIRTWDVEPGTGALMLPRGLLAEVRERHPDAEVVDRTARPTCDLATAGTLVPRDFQRDAASAVIANHGGVVVVSTGQGKTVIALHLAERLQTPTLILTHTGVLLQQTAQRCRDHLGIEPGIVQANRCDVRGVTVGMLQTFSSRGDLGLRDAFGLVVVDEAHRAPAETFFAVVSLFAARYRVGLTATPKRSDGLEPLLFDLVGPVVYERRVASLPLRYTRIDTGWKPATLPVRKPPRRKAFTLDGKPEKAPDIDHVRLMTALTTDAARNALVVQTVVDTHTVASLVLSDRVEHVRVLGEALAARGLRVVELAGRGGATAGELADVTDGLASGRYEVLVATPGKVGEGFDCPALRTLYVATPHGNAARAEQTAGRVTRTDEGKAFGRVVDFVDEAVEQDQGEGREPSRPLVGWWWRRQRVYRRLAVVVKA